MILEIFELYMVEICYFAIVPFIVSLFRIGLLAQLSSVLVVGNFNDT